jgi:hypothetical protein
MARQVYEDSNSGDLLLFDDSAQPFGAEHLYLFLCSKNRMAEYSLDSHVLRRLVIVQEKDRGNQAIFQYDSWALSQKDNFLADRSKYWTDRADRQMARNLQAQDANFEKLPSFNQYASYDAYCSLNIDKEERWRFVRDIEQSGQLESTERNTRFYRMADGTIAIVGIDNEPIVIDLSSTYIVSAFVGNLEIGPGVQATALKRGLGRLTLSQGAQANVLEYIRGDLTLGKGAQANSAETLIGDLTLFSGAQANSLTDVFGSVSIHNGAQAQSLKNVSGDLTLHKSARANCVTTVGFTLTLEDDAEANAICSVNHLNISRGAHANSLTTIFGDLNMASDARTETITKVGRNAQLGRNASASKLFYVGEDLHMVETSELPAIRYVGGTLHFEGLTSPPKVAHVGDLERSLPSGYQSPIEKFKEALAIGFGPYDFSPDGENGTSNFCAKKVAEKLNSEAYNGKDHPALLSRMSKRQKVELKKELRNLGDNLLRNSAGAKLFEKLPSDET